MTASDANIVSIEDVDLRGSEHYQRLLTSCQTICQKTRLTLLLLRWKLGERLRSACPRERDETYGAQIIQNLARDLSVDKTTLKRSRQLYDTFKLNEIGDDSSPFLTWSKAVLILPLSDEHRQQILARIQAGELRTDDACRTAIFLMLEAVGQRRPSPLGDAKPGIFGIHGLHAEKLQTLWGKASPPDRATVVAVLIPHLGLDRTDRRTALRAFHDIQRAVEDYARRLNADPEES